MIRCPPRRARPPRSRSASAAVVMIIVLVILQLAIVGAIVSGGGGGGVTAGAGGAGGLTQSRLDATRAFYAAEAGVNMALREIMLAADADGDGAIGGVSDDENDANDPALDGGARVRVTRDATGSGVALTSRATSGNARRAVRATID